MAIVDVDWFFKEENLEKLSDEELNEFRGVAAATPPLQNVLRRSCTESPRENTGEGTKIR
jgi:hypothetical protein